MVRRTDQDASVGLGDTQDQGADSSVSLVSLPTLTFPISHQVLLLGRGNRADPTLTKLPRFFNDVRAPHILGRVSEARTHAKGVASRNRQKVAGAQESFKSPRKGAKSASDRGGGAVELEWRAATTRTFNASPVGNPPHGSTSKASAILNLTWERGKEAPGGRRVFSKKQHPLL